MRVVWILFRRFPFFPATYLNLPGPADFPSRDGNVLNSSDEPTLLSEAPEGETGTCGAVLRRSLVGGVRGGIFFFLSLGRGRIRWLGFFSR